MSSGLASDEVAEDYKNSLEDLTTNDRFQISNLTVIAKENTEHAMAISRVLENHIRTTPPGQKLPALYVVDSIVKNVGTPYTLFLGRNMYQTFLNAYTLVDSQTRKKLDEMLKTWKEPVPGSLDPRPVFPPEITRSIESALIKARTAALQQQQARVQHDLVNRGRRSATPTGWTHTPPTPQTSARYPTTSNFSEGSQKITNGHSHGHQSSADSHSVLYNLPLQPSREVDLDALHRDIEALIAAARSEFASNPLDSSVQTRLQALLDLQGILQRQELSQEQLKLVRDQVSALAPSKKSGVVATTASPAVPVTSTPSVPTPPIQSVPSAFQQLLNPGTLTELIKATAARQQQPTPPPPIPAIVPQIPSTISAPQPCTVTPAENPLLAALRARGFLRSTTGSKQATAPTPDLVSAFPFIVPGQPKPLPSTSTPQTTLNPSNITIEVKMTTASIKLPRPSLISSLYDARSNRCGTCGRRFFATEEAKEKKARHLDWHFRTNQRMAEAVKRAQNRSWYVDERDWIKSRESGDDIGGTEEEGDGGAGADVTTATHGLPSQWIRAPNDATLRNTPCPICQEKFESTWSEEVQDWIWQDAVKAGSRVYHASCYTEVTKGVPGPALGTPTPGRTGTPDSVLGKRKAEGGHSPAQHVRIKSEPA